MVALLGQLIRPDGDGPDRSRATLPLLLAALAALAVTAAGLTGLAVAVVVVQTLDPAGGPSPGGAAAVAGRLWLLAQGGSLDLPSGPLVLAPLLLTLGIAAGLARAGRWVVRAAADPSARVTAGAAGVLAGVHVGLTALLGAALDAAGGGVGVLRAVLGAAVLVALCAGWGVGRETGLVDAASRRLPGAVRPLLRGVLAGLLTALALCTAVVGVAVAADASGYAGTSGSLGGAGAGAVGLLALCVLLLPNAAAAVLGLAAGPGFLVGEATVVSVHGVTLGGVPALPLLAGLPDTQAVPLAAIAAQVIPAVAALVAGSTLGRWLSDGDGGSVVAGLWGAATGAVLGVAAGAVAWVAGGSLGDGALSVVGAPPLATGLAVAAQGAVLAAPAAAIARWRARG
ncbi:DUF6350 family protein [Geodermatophilus sp. YIM 151500]|uniref:cell division protein PerM n=1 Tax=Geodermatophilus sp. YIM 151500 TaxID=2984531 RepID=UPI0021E3E1E2|nr:DUF6350 family protein [Geodermatophilus sp. YIM 151500]MCV2488480.1 DUF6350 family protein [Geodermatophilus sp. YIM 151500]